MGGRLGPGEAEAGGSYGCGKARKADTVRVLELTLLLPKGTCSIATEN